MLCKNNFLGTVLAGYVVAVLLVLENLCEKFGFGVYYILDILSQKALEYQGGGIGYALPVIVVIVCFGILGLIFIPVCFLIYGGGSSKHPVFAYKAGEILTIALTVVLFACLLPIKIRPSVGYVITGAIIGAAVAAGVNAYLKRGVKA